LLSKEVNVAAWKRKKIPGHTPEREQADKLGFALHTLRKWRRQGTGQAYIVVGREIHYVDADEPRWLASLKVIPPRREAQIEAQSVRGGRGRARRGAEALAGAGGAAP
jgi:hypothetical protein